MIDRNDLNHSGYVTAAWVKQRYKISNSTLYKWISDKHLAAPVEIGPRRCSVSPSRYQQV